MGRILTAYFRGFEQLSDPKTRSVIWQSIGWSVLIFIALYVALYVILKVTTIVAIGPLEMIFDFVAQIGVMVLTWFLFPAVVTAIGSLMLDRVVDAVESRHYPDLPMAAGQSLGEAIGPALKFLGVTVGYNLLVLPLLVFPPVWPLIPFIYLALNGYLLSREYFELVALRRVTPGDAAQLRQRFKMPLFFAGVGFSFMLTVPVLNVIAPVIATAATVHLFEAWRARVGMADKPAPGGTSGGDVQVRTTSTDVSGPNDG